MAKVSFNKLNKIKSIPSEKVDYNGIEIEIQQYLSFEDKLALISSVIDQSGNGQEGFFNIVKLDAYYKIEMIKYYTNISFTEKQLEDIPKLMDGIILNDIWVFVEHKIPSLEKEYIWNNILALAKQITEYNHSALGIVESLTRMSDVTFEEEKVNKLIEGVEGIKNSSLVKDILPLINQQ